MPHCRDAMVDTAFQATGRIEYTSSVFATRPDDVDDLYAIAEDFDNGGDFVEGVYDTQTEVFVESFLDNISDTVGGSRDSRRLIKARNVFPNNKSSQVDHLQ